MVKEGGAGCLYLVGTPIGNLEDLTLRAVRILGEADVIACEDTRETLKLLNHLGLKKKLTSYQKYSENEKKDQILDLVEQGRTVALVSDAGMPGISDPGEILVREAYRRGIIPVVVPGPSAAISGLVLSGLPADRFFFQGFLPKGREKERREVLEELKAIPATLVFYVTPHGLKKDLDSIRRELGDRPAALCRELTKIYEEVLRGSLGELLEEAERRGLRGEMVLLVEGASKEMDSLSIEEQYRLYQVLLAGEGLRPKDALKRLAEGKGINKNKLYEYILAMKEE